MFYCLYLRMHIYVTNVSLFYKHIPVALSTYACIFMTCPGLQKPHWLPLYWARRLGMALSLVESMPSMVVISHPSQENKGTRHYGKISMQDYVMGTWYEWQCYLFLPKYIVIRIILKIGPVQRLNMGGGLYGACTNIIWFMFPYRKHFFQT